MCAAIPAVREDAMKFSELASRFLQYKALRGHFTARTAECYGLAIAQFRGFLQERGLDDDVKNFNGDTLSDFAGWLAGHGNRASSVNVKLAALSSLAKYGMTVKGAKGYVLTENPVARVERPRKQAPRERYLLAEEIRAILSVEAPACERLALRLLVETQLRASAAANARVRDLTLDGDRVRLSVVEKGGNPDTFALSRELGDALLESLKLREAGPDDHILVGSSGRPYTRTSLSEMVRKLARRAGVTRIPVRAHLFARHSPASLAGQAGASEFEIMALLRHRSPGTAKRYVHGVKADAVRERVRELIGAGT